MHTLKYEHIKDFLLGGKCKFILYNKDNKHHIQFNIKQRKPKDEEDIHITYYISYHSHSDIYIGWIDKDTLQFNRNTKLLDEEDLKKCTIFSKLFEFIFKRNKYPNNIEILYSGECSVCGRELTNPKYIELGIGEYCLKNYRL